MPAPTNQLKEALKSGEVLTGCWLGLTSAYAAEIAGTAGFDWLLIDNEHAPNDLRTTMAQLQVVEASASHPLVRLPVGETHLIKQMLDIGAQSLLIPMVESGAQAQSLVNATRYPPVGVRGVGSALARASKFNEITDYLTTANDQICLMVQMESRAGYEALDDILAVDGVDGVFIGPADLAADMGHLGNPGHADVCAAIQDALGRIRAAGKTAGSLAINPKVAQQYIDWGSNFVAVGIDVTLLASAMRSLAAAQKP